MNLNDLANVGEVIGALAVVVSLIYAQRRFARTRMRSVQSLHEHFAIWYHLIASDESLAELATRGLKDYAALSDTEKARFVSLLVAFLAYFRNAFLKWKQGLWAPSLWKSWEQVMMNLIGAPGCKALWKERAYLFDDEFRRHVEDDLMKRARLTPTRSRSAHLALASQPVDAGKKH